MRRFRSNPEFTKTSPDGAIMIEQYVNKDTDDYKFQFWARWQGTFRLLDSEPADYPADFLFTNDLKPISPFIIVSTTAIFSPNERDG